MVKKIYKIWFISIISIIVVFIFYRHRQIREDFANGYDIDNQTYYVYWTGGFDSTFRVCEMLINENKRVQPFYIAFNLDNSCKEDECHNKLWLRRNKIQEIEAMKQIRTQLTTRFPNTRGLLLPTIFIENDIEDAYFNSMFEKKFYTNDLWPRKRKVHQYYFLAKYAEFNNIKIDTGVLGIHRGSKFFEYLNTYLNPLDSNWFIDDEG